MVNIGPITKTVSKITTIKAGNILKILASIKLMIFLVRSKLWVINKPLIIKKIATDTSPKFILPCEIKLSGSL